MSRTIGPIVHSSIQPFHRFKILLDKKKNVGYLEVFQQIVGIILQLICTKQFSVLIIAQIIYLVGRCTALWLWNQEVSAAPSPKAPSRNQLMLCCKNVYRPLGLKKQDSWTKTNGQRYRELQLIWHLVSWLSDVMTEGNIVKYHLRKNHLKCLCENPIVLWSNVLHWKVL